MVNGSIDFFNEFFRSMKMLGTPFQSSRYLVDAVAKEVSGRRIVELGAGNGPVTDGILRHHPNARVTAFEINPRLLKNLYRLQENPRLTIVPESAENYPQYSGEFDCVVSGLPLTSMPEGLVNKILDISKNAKRFVQYKYFPEKKLLEKYFRNIRTKVVLRNLPPALVYVCDNN